VLRQQLSGLTGHLRLCTLTKLEEVGEIATTDVLSSEEIGVMCKSVMRKEKPQGISEFSVETQPRKLLLGKNNEKYDKLVINKLCPSPQSQLEYNMTLLTKRDSIELLPLTCRSRDRGDVEPEHWTYEVACTTTITKRANPYNRDSSSANDPPITVSFSEHVRCGVWFEIPLAVDGRNVTLQPDTQYTIKIKIIGLHTCYLNKEAGSSCYRNDHLLLQIKRDGSGYFCFPSYQLRYRAIPQ
jgi:hypothetical protein